MTESKQQRVPRSRLVKASQIVLMVVTGALLVAHVFKWSFIQVDAVTLTLIGILLIAPFTDLVTRIKWGDFEAEIGRDEVAKAQAQVSVEVPVSRESDDDSYERRIRELLAEDPRLALARIRMDIEESLRRLYTSTVNADVDARRMSLGKYVDGLVAEEVLSASVASALRDVIALANRAVHGQPFEPGAANDLAILGVRLVEELQFIWSEHVVKPLIRVSITPAELEAYRNARYRVESVIPVVGEPVHNTYELDQEGLDELLEGYNEYAEFIVSVAPVDAPGA